MDRDYVDLFVKLISEQTKGIYVADLILILLFATLLMVVAKALVLKKGSEVSQKQMLLTFCTMVYAGILLLITILRRDAGSRTGEIKIHLELGSLTGGWYRVKQAAYSLLNVALFVPWGFLLRLKRKNDSHIKAVIMTGLIGFLTSFTIEFFQLATKRGVFEMTDLFTNISGTLIGAVLASIVIVIYTRLKQDNDNEEE